MSDFNFPPTGLVAVWGASGAGKTVFAKTKILPQLTGRRIVVIDPAEAPGAGGFGSSRDAIEALQDGAARVMLCTSATKDAQEMIYAAYANSTRAAPIYLIADEAPAYLAKTTDTLTRIAFTGRHRGFGWCIMAQRPAAVDAGLRSQAQVTAWMRLADHVDLDTARKAIGPDGAAQLAQLAPGQFIRHPPAQKEKTNAAS